MKQILSSAFLFIILMQNAMSQNLEQIELTPEWEKKIRELAPEKANVKPGNEPKLLLFSLHTGFYHWVLPHTDAVVKILAEKTGAFHVVQTKDIRYFNRDSLKKFDAVVLNNNCSENPKRDLFWDVLSKNADLTVEEHIAKAAGYEKNLVTFVKKGGGLMVLHGGIVMQNNSMEFSKMVGGSFDYHPRQQEIELQLTDASHPMLAPFNGKPFVHVDEAYLFKNAYFDYNFHPLLYMRTSKLTGLKEQPAQDIAYVSWIKRYGKGKVFYVSPSHNAQSFEEPSMLQFYLNGMEYVTGNLECDDSPMKK